MEKLERIKDDYLKFRIKDFILIRGYLNYCDRLSHAFDSSIEGDVRSSVLAYYNFMLGVAGALTIVELASKLLGLQGKL